MVPDGLDKIGRGWVMPGDLLDAVYHDHGKAGVHDSRRWLAA